MQPEEGVFPAMSAGPGFSPAMTGTQTMHLVFPSSQIATRNALGEVMRALAPLGLDEDRRGSLEILLAETLNNVVEHAYPGEPGGVIEMQCETCDDTLRITVQDRGVALVNGIPEGLPAELGDRLEDLPEGGFGWFLIRQLSETVTYLRQGDRNNLSLTFPLSD